MTDHPCERCKLLATRTTTFYEWDAGSVDFKNPDRVREERVCDHHFLVYEFGMARADCDKCGLHAYISLEFAPFGDDPMPKCPRCLAELRWML